MTAVSRGSPGFLEALVGRVAWQPLGIACALWARVGWVAPWFLALMPEGLMGFVPHPALSLLAAVALGHWTAWIGSALDLPDVLASGLRLIVFLMGLGLGLWLYVVLPVRSLTPEAAESVRWQATWVMVAGLGYAWWRGSRLSSGEAMDAESTLRNLFAGLLVSAAAMTLFPGVARQGAFVFLPAYLAVGLVGILIGQVHDASRRRGGRPLPFRPTWYGGLVMGVLAVVAVGIGAGMALNAAPMWGAASLVARLLAAAGSYLGKLLMPLAELLIRLIGPAFEAWILWLQGLTQGAEPTRIMPPAPWALGGEAGDAAEGATRLLGGLGSVLRVFLGVGGAVLLLWMAVRTTQRAHRVEEAGSPDAVEYLDRRPAGGSRRMGNALRRALRLPGRARGIYHALVVRRVYAQFLGWAQGEGRPRRPAETPSELGAALGRRRPELCRDIECITQAYLQVRYGERPENPGMVDDVLASWERVRRNPEPVPTVQNGVENSR